ncbi:hypothetical protein EYF80_005755 [Liparis tanakae]|uniref:Uncharacterized protein n=1 Tax=Liparis tanakae TaxID=230148 RepID=A0A4Z2J221_9TELE|nr:hypothetical protein EYF80_005755 [Liparis tanakae]
MQREPSRSLGETRAVTAHIKPAAPIHHQTSHHTSNFPPLRLSMTSGNLSRTNGEPRLNKDSRTMCECSKEPNFPTCKVTIHLIHLPFCIRVLCSSHDLFAISQVETQTVKTRGPWSISPIGETAQPQGSGMQENLVRIGNIPKWEIMLQNESVMRLREQ